MKKFWIGALIFLGVIIILWVVGRITGTFANYTSQSSAMEPALKVKGMFFASTLIKPDRYDIVIYNRKLTKWDLPGATERTMFVHRLIAVGGETVEIKNGLAYVDGKLVDDSTKLKFEYIIPGTEFNKAAIALDIPVGEQLSDDFWTVDESMVCILTHNEYQKVKTVAPIQKYDDKRFPAEALYRIKGGEEWTINNYGPIKVPADSAFVLGDNRDMSSDSRFNGFVKIKGVVLWKK